MAYDAGEYGTFGRLDHFQLGLVTAFALGVLGGAGYLLLQYPRETAFVVAMVVGMVVGLYSLGFVTSQVLAFTPARRARAVKAAHEEAEHAYAEAVPAAMVLLHGGKDGRYGSAVYTLFGEDTELHRVGPGTEGEIAAQAQAVSDQHGVNTVCVYLADSQRCVTFIKAVDGSWSRGWDDEGSAGVGRLKKRAAAVQRQHEQAAT
ncbi:hypothetical protein O9X98_05990 [Agrobacterium salinitolerans]|nr:hypothetical protein [Agrobacterium salinitolerans]